MKLLLPLLLGCLVLTAQAQTTYRWVDPKTGQTVFSDKPPPAGVKQISQQRQAGDEDPNGDVSYGARKAAENFPVVLYTSADCTDACRQSRDLLNARGVPFREKMVATPEDSAELMKLTGGELYVPVLLVGKQSSKGFQAGAWNNLLDLAGYPKTAPYGYKPRGGLEK